MIRRLLQQLQSGFSPVSVILFIVLVAVAVTWLPGFLQGLLR